MKELASKRNDIYKRKAVFDYRLNELIDNQAQIQKGTEFICDDIPSEIRDQIEYAVEEVKSQLENERAELWDEIGETYSEAEELLIQSLDRKRMLEKQLQTLGKVSEIPIIGLFTESISESLETELADCHDLSKTVRDITDELSEMRTKVVKK